MILNTLCLSFKANKNKVRQRVKKFSEFYIDIQNVVYDVLILSMQI